MQHAAASRPGNGESWVLVVDDDAETRAAFAEVLQEAGLRVVTAEDGDAALRLVRERLPALAIVDLVMPKVDGWSFITALRALPDGQSVPVISMTAHGTSILAGAPVSQGYLAKPVSLVHLLDAVGRLCGFSALRSTDRPPPLE